MKSVSRFEANLLRLLHFFLQQAPVQQALPLLESKIDRPKRLSADAVELVKDALSKGCPVLLARLGGWCRERHLRNDRPAEGRLWERTPPAELGLNFSRYTLDFLVWTTAKKDLKKGWEPPARTPTVGDLVLLYFAYFALRGHDLAVQLLNRAPFDTHGLCWLTFPDDYARAGLKGGPDFGPWLQGVGACVVEALQPVLVARWLEVEVDKGKIAGWQPLRDLGRAQDLVADALLPALDQTSRLDLARFLLRAAERLVTPTATTQLWLGNLRQQAPRLADRADTYRGALAFLRQLPRLQQWERHARTVGYFDEGYAASQLWKSDWERHHGDELTERAQTLIRQLDPMRQTEDQS